MIKPPVADIYQLILNKFPQKYIKFAFAYGSAVFKQLENEKNSKSMIDFVFVVDDSIKFHDENLKLNWSHYSFLKYTGPYYINRIQNDFASACYYNTLVSLKLDNEAYLVKYGVVSQEALIRDLYDWDFLYLSGRLQKPVRIIKSPSDVLRQAESSQQEQQPSSSTIGIDLNYNFESVNKSIDLALQTNLKNALHASLLLLPEKFTLLELFTTIASLSYSGDFRMIIGENRNKVNNIVQPQLAAFTELYKLYLIKECFEEHLNCNFETGIVTQSLDRNTVYHHLTMLPKNLIQTMINLKFKTTHYYDLEEYTFKIANRIDYNEIVMESIRSIVKYASAVQSFKGVFTAGFFKTVNYSFRKLKKMIN
jgi:translocator assembly and maintenance protein 41